MNATANFTSSIRTLEQDLPRFEAPTSAYLHIPFCRRRCYYCDFPVSIVGDRLTGSTSGTIQQYVEVLCREIAVAPVMGPALRTVFFGGGTPSLLSVEQLSRILAQLEKRFGIRADAEISIEMDPGTFVLPQIKGYQTAGVNRVSLGVQAFQPELLAVCGRSHTISEIYAAVDLIHQANVSNFSLDLISGLPHQTLDQWQESLTAAIKLAPHHLSVYDLIVEPVTAFGRQYQPGVEPLPTEAIAAQMYRLAQRTLTTAGYQHYEISNYAQADYQCQHNRTYWENRSYYGFGMGAASYTQGCRFTRPRKTREYFQWVEDGGIKGESEISCLVEVLLDTLMLGLRLAEGLSLARLTERFGAEIVERILACLQPYHQQELVEIVSIDNRPITSLNLEAKNISTVERIRLSDPEGFLLSNTVLTALFREFDQSEEAAE